MQINGAQAVLKALEHEGVDTVFGMPGGAILPVYDPLIDSKLRHILVRHEQGAGHMASGYAHATGRPGVAMVTSGPAATNMVTALLDAYMDSIPVVCITGQVSLAAIGTDAFQEADTTGITMSATKHNYLITDVNDIPQVIHDAFHLATTGRPGPVLVDIPKNVVTPDAMMEWYEPTGHDLPGYRPNTIGDPEAIRAAAEMIRAAERPIIYAGGGILRARAAEVLLELAELTGIPVVTTLMNRGGFPDDHELCLGMPGMHGNYTAVMAMQNADLLIALGARFDDRVTGDRSTFAPGAKIIHVDIDPAELGKVRHAHVPIAGDAKQIIGELNQRLAELGGLQGQPDRTAWRQTLSGWQEKYPLVYGDHVAGKLLKPQMVIETLRDNTPSDTIVVAGVGQHQMWTSQYWKFNHPYTWINSGGLGTMGFAVPAAIGAKVGKPDRMVWAVDGDGCFQMTAQELTTAAIEKIPVKIAILNNRFLGMVRQWQDLFYDERFSETDLGDIPNFKMMAESMGCAGFRVDSPEEVEPTIAKANEINDRPVVIDFRTQPDENVYPMVPAGASNDAVLVDPSQRDK